jgi:hypothetical protein
MGPSDLQLLLRENQIIADNTITTKEAIEKNKDRFGNIIIIELFDVRLTKLKTAKYYLLKLATNFYFHLSNLIGETFLLTPAFVA